MQSEVDNQLIMSEEEFLEKKEFQEATHKVIFEAAAGCVFLSMKQNNQYEADSFTRLKGH